MHAEDLLVHDETLEDPAYAYMLSNMKYPDLPTPVGIFRRIKRETYETMVREQESEAAKRMPADLGKLLNSKDSWKVE